MSDSPLIEIDDLTVRYSTGSAELTAVSNVSITIQEGEYFGLVGESGCGKSTLAAAVLGGLDENGYVESGGIRYKGETLRSAEQETDSEEYRWDEISWIPQSSMNSLDPLKQISEQARDIARANTDMSPDQTDQKLRDLFDVVGLQEDRIHDYPNEFSGGMQQRALIALALLLDPSLIIADEPTTALDVVLQDAIMGYLEDLRQQDVGMLLITHDISVVLETCDKIGVMHGGQLAEVGPIKEVYDSGRHPYTILLQDAFPDIRYPKREPAIIGGKPPQTIGDIEYCTFEERCPWAVPECGQSAPDLELVEPGQSEHLVSCFRKDEIRELHQQEQATSGESEP